MKKYCKHTLFMVTLIVMVSFQSSAQHPLSTVFSISRHHFVDTVKVKIWDGAIIVPVEIEGRKRHLFQVRHERQSDDCDRSQRFFRQGRERTCQSEIQGDVKEVEW